jgi:hypothetical protein
VEVFSLMNQIRAMLSFCEAVLREVPEDLLYARVDFLPIEGKFALMELELIEPALYFRTGPVAAKNFVRELLRR